MHRIAPDGMHRRFPFLLGRGHGYVKSTEVWSSEIDDQFLRGFYNRVDSGLYD